MSKKVLKIYGVPFSVHTRKVIVAARCKAIPYEITPVVPLIPDNPPPHWRTLSPTGLIPAIDDDGYVLADSTAIVLYLERRNPEPALLPADAKDYGAALFLDAWAGSALFRQIGHPLFHNQVVAPSLRKVPGDRAAIGVALNEGVPQAFGYLELRAPERFLVGGALTIADVAVVSNLLLFHYLGHRIDAATYPRLAAYFQRHRDSAAFAPVLEAERPFIDGVPGLDRNF
jgi:glutathione S-transferase